VKLARKMDALAPDAAFDQDSVKSLDRLIK
jgi:hypothetical protein